MNFDHSTLLFPLGLLLLGCVHAGAAMIDAARAGEIARLLPEKPLGLCRPVHDRSAWEKLAPCFRSEIGRAEDIAAKPVPEQPDDLYLDFSRTGNRTRWQSVAGRRRGAIRILAIAECVENKGRFLPKLQEYIQAICSEPTWVMPAHDRSLANFHGKVVDIDLGSSMLAWDLATADYLLGGKLDPEVRAVLRRNIDERIITPMRDMLSGRRQGNWWLYTTNNWNAVCLACVTGAALAIVESREDRAFFAAGAEKLIRNFLKGFTPDGYCSEGVGYWNYGFGHFVMLAETLYQNTAGRLDLLKIDRARAAALYGARIEIMNGIYPAFADCGVSARPSAAILRYVNLRLGLGLRRYEQYEPIYIAGSLYGQMLSALGDSASACTPVSNEFQSTGPRDWFPDAGVLICRPGPGDDCRMAAAIKGGHNNEHHNHNDLGTYVIVVSGQVPVIDVGGEVYTSRTFSGRRYDSNVLNSFGHSVPVIAGQLQSTGGNARAIVRENTFSDDIDILVFDLKSAYDAPSLQSLKRTFCYSRAGEGALEVRDEVAFGSPETFETAIMTFGSYKQVDARTLWILDGDAGVEVSIVAEPDVELKIGAVEIDEDASAKKTPTRIGVAFSGPVLNASLTLRYRPVFPGGS